MASTRSRATRTGPRAQARARHDQGAAAQIRFATACCALGHVLVAASSKGLCAILLGDDPRTLRQDLATRFAGARIDRAGPGFEQEVRRVTRLIESPGEPFELPLDPRGTPFQQRVWRALRQVRAGTTTSYAQLARRIGDASAARAVAQACAANALAVAVPCHRVMRGDGALAGYRWGVERKRELLRREGRP
jgi:AraC family transcriptional regulator, regulatory protein of adaptative response / methylated-DNA-[protein]-cysteine methyltransferase